MRSSREDLQMGNCMGPRTKRWAEKEEPDAWNQEPGIRRGDGEEGTCVGEREPAVYGDRRQKKSFEESVVDPKVSNGSGNMDVIGDHDESCSSGVVRT